MSKAITQLINKIENKKFKKTLHAGYDMEDVDHFNDEVINDLNRTIELNQNTERENVKLREINDQNKSTITTLNERLKSIENELKVYKSEGYTVVRNELHNNKEEK
ncbi:MAG: DivIVA domain-containing protein [Mycoplasmataceae bacterium]|jgi:DivIVA domain-containing protein|nr:DivIVA domain-containing protein [Mycoplasmataceae bacterium]